MTVRTVRGVTVMTLVLAALLCAPASFGQQRGAGETGGASRVTGASMSAESVAGMAIDELRVRLAPLERGRIEALADEMLAALRVGATTLADAIVERMRLQQAAAPDAEALAASDALVESLLGRKKELVSRMNVVLAAIEAKGGDVASARAYVSAVDTLHPEDTSRGRGGGDGAGRKTADAADAVRDRTAELVSIVRGEPPAHERAVPWDVPLSEFELELQPLPVEAILARLEQWRELLEREVRKRVRIDILLNNGEKLEQVRAERRAVAAAAGTALDEVSVDAIKTQLAAESQEQQRIVNAIVERMEVGIRMVERRGGDAASFADYVASATGQRLNLADPTVLRAQLMAWLRSKDGGVKLGLNLAKFLAIVLVFWVLSRMFAGVTSAAVRRVPNASSLLRPVLAGAVRRLTMLIGLVIGVSMLGVNIGPLLALIGAAGLVIGLALQGTLSNFASGILILLNRPYDVGDVINAGGITGKVEAMNLVSTSVLTPDNQLMLVPNNQIWNGVIKNVTGKSTRRVDLTFGIGYGDDIDKAIAIIRETVTSHPKVMEDPAPAIKVHELADNSVNIIARPWSATSDYWDVYWDVTHQVKTRFDEEGLNIPYPQRDVHIPGPIEVKFATDGASFVRAGEG